MAFNPSLIGQMDDILAEHGSWLPETPLDHDSVLVRCIAGGRDQQSDPLVLRALRLGISAIPQTLTDGRMAFCGYWTLSALAAIESGEIIAEEITEVEYKALQPVEPIE